MYELLGTVNGLDVIMWLVFFLGGRGYQRLVQHVGDRDRARMIRDNLDRPRR